MKKTFSKQLWVALNIWVIAVSVNTFLGTLCLADMVTIAIMPVGFVFSAIFSFPIVVILLIIMDHCVSRRKSGQTIFSYVFIAGLLLSICATVLFLVLLPEAPPGLLAVSFIAAGIGIGLQYSSILSLANYDNEFQR